MSSSHNHSSLTQLLGHLANTHSIHFTAYTLFSQRLGRHSFESAHYDGAGGDY